RETIRHAPRASAMHRPPHCPRTAPTYRLQTVSKTGAHLRVLARISEEVERGLNLPIRGAKRRIGVRRRLVTHVQRFRVRFPCATAKFSILRWVSPTVVPVSKLSPITTPGQRLSANAGRALPGYEHHALSPADRTVPDEPRSSCARTAPGPETSIRSWASLHGSARDRSQETMLLFPSHVQGCDRCPLSGAARIALGGPPQ